MCHIGMLLNGNVHTKAKHNIIVLLIFQLIMMMIALVWIVPYCTVNSDAAVLPF